MFYLIILLGLKAITVIYPCNSLKTYQEKIFKGLIWNAVFEFIQDCYLVMAVSCFANLTNFTFESFGKSVSAILTILAIVILIGYPIFSLIFLVKFEKQLKLGSFM